MEYQKITNKIWLIRNFLSPQECEQLIILSESRGYQEAEVGLSSGSKMMKGIRNNYRIKYEDSILAEKYWNHIKEFCPKELNDWEAIGIYEKFRFYRYELNQRFKRHIDGRIKRNETEESRITFMIYLNDDYEGGETKFNDVEIRPETGMALLFIHEQKHEGSPVIDGEKYVLRTDVMYRKKKN